MKRTGTNRLLRYSAALAGTLMIVGAAGTPRPVYAQAAGENADKKVTLNLRETPLRDALNLLFAGSGLQFSVDPNVQNVPITLNIRDISLQAALRMVTRQAASAQPGLTFSRDGDVFVVKVRQQTNTQPTDTQEPLPPEDLAAEQELTWEKIPIQFNDVTVFVIAFGGTMLPTEADIKGGGMMGGMGMGGMGGGMMGGMGGMGMGMGGMGGGMMGGMGGMMGGMGGMGMGGMGMGGMGMGGMGMGGMGGGMMGGMGGFGGGGMGGFGRGF